MDSLPYRLLITVLLIFITSVVRFAKASVTASSEARLKKLSDNGDKKATEALKLLEKNSRAYHSLKLISIFSELLAGCTVSLSVIEYVKINEQDLYLYPILIGAILALTIVLQLFCVFFPQKITAKNPEKIIFSLTRLIKLAIFICTPIERTLHFITSLVLSPFGVTPMDKDEEEVTEEDIRFMVDIGSESGAIDPDEKEMIHNIFELDDTPVKDIMTHRTDVEFLWKDDGLDVWEETISCTNHTIYPVSGETVDDILGIVKTTDFYKLLRNNSSADSKDLKSIIKSPYLVPETIKADDLFRQMQQTKNHFAIVLDEYGGLAGIITMSDLLEEIVGNLDTNSEAGEEDDIVQLDSNTWKILGSTDIEIVAEFLNIDLPLEEYNTFAGLILEELGAIPDDGSTCELEAYGLLIKVTKISEHRIDEAIVCKLLESADDEIKK